MRKAVLSGYHYAFLQLFCWEVFFMEKVVVNMVQAQIGYTFQNLDLLRQAFIRRSYTEEHGGENNEVLESWIHI